MKMKIKVQCVSTDYGYHKDLNLGKWYDVIEQGKWYQIISGGDSGLVSQFQHLPFYEKRLFRTLDERREDKLNKILK